jgi:hypothetical protein
MVLVLACDRGVPYSDCRSHKTYEFLDNPTDCTIVNIVQSLFWITELQRHRTYAMQGAYSVGMVTINGHILALFWDRSRMAVEVMPRHLLGGGMGFEPPTPGSQDGNRANLPHLSRLTPHGTLDNLLSSGILVIESLYWEYRSEPNVETGH